MLAFTVKELMFKRYPITGISVGSHLDIFILSNPSFIFHFNFLRLAYSVLDKIQETAALPAFAQLWETANPACSRRMIKSSPGKILLLGPKPWYQHKGKKFKKQFPFAQTLFLKFLTS